MAFALVFVAVGVLVVLGAVWIAARQIDEDLREETAAVRAADPGPVTADDRAVLVRRMTDFADELVDPLVCREPAYGAAGVDHCAACCGGTGLIITCPEEEAVADAAVALRVAAALIAKLD